MTNPGVAMRDTVEVRAVGLEIVRERGIRLFNHSVPQFPHL